MNNQNEQCCAVCGEDIKAGICFDCLSEDISVIREAIEELEERITRLEKKAEAPKLSCLDFLPQLE
ncbi:MAG: hypothetical protein QXF17_03425 [Ignisphaera sp.]